MTAIGYDVRSAIRSLIRHPGTSLSVILTLALGMGASTAIFSVIRGVLLRPLPYPESQQIVAIPARTAEGAGWEISWLNFTDLATAPSLEKSTVYLRSGMFLFEKDEPQLVFGAEATHDLFSVLRTQPVLGRTFTPEEDREGGARVVIISHALWTAVFDQDRNILGHQLRTNTGTGGRTIIGVMPEGFRFPVTGEETSFWIPIGAGLGEQARTRRDMNFMTMIGRLREGATVATAQNEIEAIAQRLEQQYPASNRGARFNVIAMREWITGDIRGALWILLAGVGAVLLIGCANIANLLLGRAVGRMRELAVRSALGAAHFRIARQLLAESVLLGVAAGLVGLGICYGSLSVLKRLAPPDLPRMNDVAMDPLVFAFAFAIAIMTGVLFGLAPALAVMRSNLVTSLRESGNRGATESRRANGLRRGLVITEIALSLLLLASAGLLMRSFWHLIHTDPGYEASRAVYLNIAPRATHETDEQIVNFYQDLLARLRGVPGVTGVAATRVLPFHYTNLAYSFRVQGRPFDPATPPDGAAFTVVTPGYFDTMKIRLLRGREFTDRDDARSVPVVIISEMLAKEQFGEKDPLGERFAIEPSGLVAEIVGIVGDIREAERQRPPVPIMYVPFAQLPNRQMRVIVRTAASEGVAATQIRRVVREIDPLQPIVKIESFDRVQSEALANRKLALALVSALAVLAFLLSAVGIYSVMAYMVAQRRSEIAVRMALGAQPREIFRMILSQTTALFAIGSLIGVMAALSMRQVMQKFLYGITSSDPTTFILIVGLLGGVALLAGWLPARRAALVDPLVALRSE